jgi:hypothetical protein
MIEAGEVIEAGEEKLCSMMTSLVVIGLCELLSVGVIVWIW